MELEVVSDVANNFGDGQVDKHTSDLWCEFITSDLLNKLIDELSNLVLVGWVGGVNQMVNLETRLVICSNVWWEVLCWDLSSWCAHWWYLHTWLHHNGWLLLGSHLRWHLLGWHLAWSASWWHLLLLLLLSLLETTLVVLTSLATLSHWSLLVVELWSLVDLLSLKSHHEVLQELECLGSVQHVNVEGSWGLLSVVLEVASVLSFFLLDLSDFLLLVEVQEELFTV